MLIHFRLLSRPSSYLIYVRSIRTKFSKAFGKYLYLTNTITCGVLMGAGDIVQQKIEAYKSLKKDFKFDWHRSGRMFLVGLATGPPQHIFYKVLDGCIPRRDFRSISMKILIDQLVASPMCLLIFFFGMGYLELRNYQCIVDEMKEKFITIYTVDWLVWPPTQFINFYFLSPKFRVAYINFITMVYNVFLSYVKHDMKFS